jgi:2-oxo-4-hydroxy-4-carboxy--5-ureidoimidazoline (OHCU) decarboxylase
MFINAPPTSSPRAPGTVPQFNLSRLYAHRALESIPPHLWTRPGEPKSDSEKMTTSLPDVSQIPSLPSIDRATILDTLFEPCTQLHTLSVSTLAEQNFKSYPDLVSAVGKQLLDLFYSNLESDQKWLDVILSAHPRLGEKKVESELSRREQEAMRKAEQATAGGGGVSGDGEDIAAKLKVLNEKYEERFPGLRYV